jgi:D-glycero-D-manno-heptose 1,7-bisphosphate phosphatase
VPALFLDRDGVVNVRTPGDYVKTPDTFIPTPGFETAIRLLAAAFDPIIVVTNQAGIGKGLMSEADLHAVHEKMLRLAQEAGGRIDRIYYCPHPPDALCPCRKPATGMAWQALADFPQIDFEDAWIAGDSASDMVFGQALGLRTVLIQGKMEEWEKLRAMQLNFRFPSLLGFAEYVCLKSKSELSV